METRIVIAADSFKGSLSSAEANEAIAEGVRRVLPDASLTLVPVADGGEGTMPMLVESLGGKYEVCRVGDPLLRPITAQYGIINHNGIRTAVIEMAQASGLPLLKEEERNPLITSSYGTGQLIADAYRRGCRAFIIGLGGSATNDGGAGMLRALGVKFLDNAGQPLPEGGAALKDLSSIDLSEMPKELRDCPFTIICDVDNPLTGPNGASAVFGPQKGATPQDVDILDKALQNYGEMLEAVTGRSLINSPGSGAAGGMGAALLACFNAELKPGIQATLDTIGFRDIIRGASLIVTGEGKIDRQTLHGKTPFGILQYAKTESIPVIAIGGLVEDEETLLNAGSSALISAKPDSQSLAEAMNPEKARANLSQAAEKGVRIFLGSPFSS